MFRQMLRSVTAKSATYMIFDFVFDPMWLTCLPFRDRWLFYGSIFVNGICVLVHAFVVSACVVLGCRGGLIPLRGPPKNVVFFSPRASKLHLK